MKLYGYFRSSAAFRVRIALNLKGLDYRQDAVHLVKGEQRAPAFLALNPQGLVPLLALDGLELTQSLAIVEYLDETRPKPALLPASPAGRARVRSLALIVACDIHPLNNVRVLRSLTGEMGADDARVGDWYRHWCDLGLDALETRLAREPETGRFCHGDRPTLADICLVPQIFNTLRYDKETLARRPVLRRIFETCMALPAFERAQPSRQPDAEP
jgi:maleylacetoacetate isomerase